MRITTARLLLREYEPGDLTALLACHADPRAREFYGPEEAQPDQVRELLRTFETWASERPRRNYQLAIALGADAAALVGSAGLRQAGLQAGTADLGLELAPGWWGRGFATEAGSALLNFGFGRLGLDTIRGLTISANTRVAALVRRLRFEHVAEHPGAAWMSERGWTETEWRLTRERWTFR
ncbi:MAG: GNAT family N-acetyltransferase [Gemmatimonadales bacterium]|nr:GNAT family N-acetyltransferase [Gemmatimonadales bacterium]